MFQWGLACSDWGYNPLLLPSYHLYQNNNLGDGVASQAFEDFKHLVNFLQSEVIFIGMPKTIAEPGCKGRISYGG